jgi:hypothetical protein
VHMQPASGREWATEGRGSEDRSGQHRWLGAWSLLAMAGAVGAGVLVGDVWLPLGLCAAAVVGMVLDGVGAALVGVLGALLGAPLLRSLLHVLTHSWADGPAVLVGLLVGLAVRRKASSRLAQHRG